MKRRNTPTKEAVLNLLSESGKALSQDAIERNIDIEINRATIYRVLNRFCEDGILHRIMAEDGKQYFACCSSTEEGEIPHHHFHFHCKACQTIECLEGVVNYQVPDGYTVKHVNSVLSGLCAKCS